MLLSMPATDLWEAGHTRYQVTSFKKIVFKNIGWSGFFLENIHIALFPNMLGIQYTLIMDFLLPMQEVSDVFMHLYARIQDQKVRDFFLLLFRFYIDTFLLPE